MNRKLKGKKKELADGAGLETKQPETRFSSCEKQPETPTKKKPLGFPIQWGFKRLGDPSCVPRRCLIIVEIFTAVLLFAEACRSWGVLDWILEQTVLHGHGIYIISKWTFGLNLLQNHSAWCHLSDFLELLVKHIDLVQYTCKSYYWPSKELPCHGAFAPIQETSYREVRETIKVVAKEFEFQGHQLKGPCAAVASSKHAKNTARDIQRGHQKLQLDPVPDSNWLQGFSSMYIYSVYIYIILHNIAVLEL